MTDLIARAHAGDDVAFAQLVDPHRREIQVHCYRLLGSVQDAEDALQETLLAAWQGFAAFEARASVRTWLYRIATNRCLNVLRSARRRPEMDRPPPSVQPPEPTRLGEVMWRPALSRCPARGHRGGRPRTRGPHRGAEVMSLAFITALQLLPPLQRGRTGPARRARLPRGEVAALLDTTDESVSSALKRACAGLQRKLPAGDRQAPPPEPGSPEERELLERLTLAYETGDLDGVVVADGRRLAHDAAVPFEYQGRELTARFLEIVAFRLGRQFRQAATLSGRRRRVSCCGSSWIVMGERLPASNTQAGRPTKLRASLPGGGCAT